MIIRQIKTFILSALMVGFVIGLAGIQWIRALIFNKDIPVDDIIEYRK